MTDCEKLSPNALAIFKRLEPFFPPDPWKNPQWKIEGIVLSNGSFDLRMSQDRDLLMERVRATLGNFVETVAGVFKTKNGSLEGFEIDHFGSMIRHEVEKLFVLRDLDFQIETGDLIDG